MRWRKNLLLLGLGLVDFEGLAGFILFLLVLAAVLLWGVYQLAQIIIPALLMGLLVLGFAFIPFHYWSKTTLDTRASRTIARCLREIRTMERLELPRTEIMPFEQRLREAARAFAGRLYDQSQRCERRV